MAEISWKDTPSNGDTIPNTGTGSFEEMGNTIEGAIQSPDNPNDGDILTYEDDEWIAKAVNIEELSFVRYGKDMLDGSKNIFSDLDEVSVVNNATYQTIYTLTINESLDATFQSGGTYLLYFEYKTKGSDTSSQSTRWYNSTTAQTLYEVVTSSTSYATKGSFLTPFAYEVNYGDTIVFQMHSQYTNSIVYAKDVFLWYLNKLPSVITTAIMTAKGFSGVKYIELYDTGDSVKINNSKTYTGVSGCPTGLCKATDGYTIFNPSDYSSITQIEIVSGNPLIVFKKV